MAAWKKTCSVEGCDRDKEKRGMCNMHYKRWRRWGDPSIKYTDKTALDRFWSKVRKTSNCWIWEAALNDAGYGLFGSPAGYSKLAHRFAYQALIGPVPGNMPLDHLCRNRRCVNPVHLEPVSLEENKRRGLQYRIRNGMDDSCINGHKYTPENTYWNPNKPHDFRCRACKPMHYTKDREVN